MRFRKALAKYFAIAGISLFGLLPLSCAAEETLAPVGLDNPTLAFNLQRVVDYDVGFQFLDLMKMTVPWIGHRPGQWGGMDWGDLKRGGYLDEDGWLMTIPDELEKVGVLWRWSEVPDSLAHKVGTYILDYKGTGVLKLRGDAHVISSQPGRIMFENRNGGSFYLNIYETDPRKNGDYIRNITIVREDHYELFQAGAVFNPDWVELITDARQLRFMNWLSTNNPTIVTWSEMPSPTAPPSPHGIALADMVKLANEIGADPWFTMPRTADDNYVRQFAIYVRDRLDPALQVRVEFSNEAWNWAFPGTQRLHEEALLQWGVKDGQNDYYVKRSVEIMRIWEDEFGDEAETRLVRVLSGQAMNTWLTKQLLEAAMWKKFEPDAWAAPGQTFDEFAITLYFGGKETASDKLRAPFLAAIRNQNMDASQYLVRKMQDPRHPASVPFMKRKWQEHKKLTDRAGLRLIAYEGGSHLHHLFATGVGLEDSRSLTKFFGEFAISLEMAKIYRDAWTAWMAAGDGPFMQFTEIGKTSKWGSFGLRKSLDDNNPTARMLDQLNGRTKPWWSAARGGTHYQHGVIRIGDRGPDKLIGTTQEDYLIGKSDNDVLRGGPGDDGLHGGPGTDQALFSGKFSQYIVRPYRKGYRVDGPDGRDFLFDIEELVFEDTGSFVLTKMRLSADGILSP